MDKPVGIPKDTVSDIIKNGITDEHSKSENTPKPRKTADYAAWFSLLFALAAWCVLMFEGYTALVLSLVGLLAGIMGLRAERRSLRNLSITSIVACSVLAITIGAFLFVLFVGLNAV